MAFASSNSSMGADSAPSDEDGCSSGFYNKGDGTMLSSDETLQQQQQQFTTNTPAAAPAVTVRVATTTTSSSASEESVEAVVPPSATTTTSSSDSEEDGGSSSSSSSSSSVVMGEVVEEETNNYNNATTTNTNNNATTDDGNGPKRGLRVLFLSSDTGGGHRASAESLAKQFELLFPGSTYDLLDIVEKDGVPPYNSLVSYYKHLSAHPAQWKLVYSVSNSRAFEMLADAHLKLMCERAVRRSIKSYRPDVVVSVHPLMTNVPVLSCSKISNETGRHLPIFTVVTDLGSAHCLWFANGVERMFVGSNKIRNLALSRGKVDPQKLQLIGLPIRHDFAIQADAMDYEAAAAAAGANSTTTSDGSEEDNNNCNIVNSRYSSGGKTYQMKIRMELNYLDLSSTNTNTASASAEKYDRKTILVMGGGEGVGSLSNIVEALYVELVTQGIDAIILVVCGRNEKLKSSIRDRNWSQVFREWQNASKSQHGGAIPGMAISSTGFIAIRDACGAAGGGASGVIANAVNGMTSSANSSSSNLGAVGCMGGDGSAGTVTGSIRRMLSRGSLVNAVDTAVYTPIPDHHHQSVGGENQLSINNNNNAANIASQPPTAAVEDLTSSEEEEGGDGDNADDEEEKKSPDAADGNSIASNNTAGGAGCDTGTAAAATNLLKTCGAGVTVAGVNDTCGAVDDAVDNISAMLSSSVVTAKATNATATAENKPDGNGDDDSDVGLDLEGGKTPGNVSVVGLGFVTRMAEYMVAADVLVSKAGPGTISEAAALSLPVMLTSFLPGQEEGNVDYVLENGFGSYVPDTDPIGIAEEVCMWLTDETKLRQLSTAAKRNGAPHAARDIVQMIGDSAMKWMQLNDEKEKKKKAASADNNKAAKQGTKEQRKQRKGKVKA